MVPMKIFPYTFLHNQQLIKVKTSLVVAEILISEEQVIEWGGRLKKKMSSRAVVVQAFNPAHGRQR